MQVPSLERQQEIVNKLYKAYLALNITQEEKIQGLLKAAKFDLEHGRMEEYQLDMELLHELCPDHKEVIALVEAAE